MPFINWSDKYSVGVAQFDTQHQKLIELINGLHEAMMARKANEAIGKILAELIAYTQTHFTAEEALMQQYGYPGQAAHVLEHKALVAKVLDFETRFKAKTLALSIDLLDFLSGWLVNHIQKTDNLYGPFFKGKGAA